MEGHLVHGLLHPEMGHMKLVVKKMITIKENVLTMGLVLKAWPLVQQLKKDGASKVQN